MINRSIQNPFIPRSGLNKGGKSFTRNTSATIKADYEDNDEDESYVSPGPGSYRTEISDFREKKIRTTSLQLFGSNVSRFKEKPLGTSLGPGQYRVHPRIGIKNNSVIASAGSAAFKSPSRPDFISMINFDLPGPGEYANEMMQNALTAKLREKKNVNGKQSFGVNQKRFDKSDTLPPGPGQYLKAEVEVGAMHKPGQKTMKVDEGPKHFVVSSACNINGIKGELASYKSATVRELD